MRRIAVVHASFLGGGAEAVCLWSLQALKDEFDLTLVTLCPVDFAALDAYYGTTLTDAGIRVDAVLGGSRAASVLATNNSTFTLRQHLLSSLFRRKALQFDVCFSTFNEMDFGRQGVQYVHFPMFTLDGATRRLMRYPDSSFRSLVRRTTAAVTRFSASRARENLTITNSRWTADLITRCWAATPRVVYPPVPSSYPPAEWNAREDGFVCISRIVPEKSIEQAIRIVEAVRQQGFELHLRLVGGTKEGRQSAYYRHILALQRKRRQWLSLDHDLSRAELATLLTRYKFGLHTREREQFGIGVAEMVLAGCIPFVPAEGGQSEIVGAHPLLTFHDERDAVQKIVRVLSERHLQPVIRDTLEEQRPQFSEGQFMRDTRALIREFADTR